MRAAENMSGLSEVIGKDLASYYAMGREQTRLWADPLTEEQLWRRPFAHGNSVGHLLLHITGNLNTQPGARSAEPGYVRDHDRYCSESERRPKADVLASFDAAVAM